MLAVGSYVRGFRALLVVAACGCTAGDDIPAPIISSIVPDHGPAGATVMVVGDYFCQQPESDDDDPLACETMGAVEFDQIPSTSGTYSERLIMSEVPAIEPGNVGVAVAINGRRSNRVDFLVDAP